MRRKALLLLVLLGAMLCSLLVANSALAEKAAIAFKDGPAGSYAIFLTDMDTTSLTKPLPSVEWDFDPPATPIAPYSGYMYYTILYDETRFSGINPLVSHGAWIHHDNYGTYTIKPTDQTALSSYMTTLFPGKTFADILGKEFATYKIYGTLQADDNKSVEIAAQLYCKVTLDPGLLTNPNNIRSTSHANLDMVPYNDSTDFVFTVTVPRYKLPYVYKDYNMANKTLALKHDSISNNVTTYTFTYNVGKITQNVTYHVEELADAYTVTLDTSYTLVYDVYDALAYSTHKIFPFNVIDATEDFTFVMQFTQAYLNNQPNASVNGYKTTTQPNLGVSKDANISGKFYITVPLANPVSDLNIVFAKEDWSISQLTIHVEEHPDYYTVLPSASTKVDYNSPGVFYLKPTVPYAANRKKPIITVYQGHTCTVEWDDAEGAWKCTIPNVLTTLAPTVNVSGWDRDLTAPVGDTVTVSFPTGNGYSVSDHLGGTPIGNNKFQVVKGNNFTFSVNVMDGYDRSSLQVLVNGYRIYPVNNTYTLDQVSADLAVTITVNKTASASSSPGKTSPGASGKDEDDGTLKYREIYEEKLGVLISGFFVGVPEIVVTELKTTDPVYIRMLNSTGVQQDKVLRAVDIQIKNAIAYGAITVGIQVGAGYNTIEMLLAHGTVNGDELYSILGYNGMANVTVRSTSPFMVVDPYGLGPGIITNTSSTTGAWSSDAGAGANEDINFLPPRTGGAQNVMGFVLIGVVVGCVLFIVWYRKRA